MNYEQCEGCDPRKTMNCDQEVWVKDRINTAIQMALKLSSVTRVRADDPLLACAIEGVINGAAVEIARTLNMEPEFTNLRRPPLTDPVF
jgi:hypothetical protein